MHIINVLLSNLFLDCSIFMRRIWFVFFSFHFFLFSLLFFPVNTLYCSIPFSSTWWQSGSWSSGMLTDSIYLFIFFFFISKNNMLRQAGIFFQVFGHLAAIPESNMGLVQLDNMAGMSFSWQVNAIPLNIL